MLSNEQLIRLIFGFKLRYLRTKHNYSLHELADRTGLSKSYLNDIEKGKKYPRSQKISKLAEAFDIDYNDLVSTTASKKLQPVIDLLSSKFFKVFPLEKFGIDAERLIELFTKTPERVNAFISSILNLSRQYQINEEEFYKVALRSWQDMHDNYFEDIEQLARDFREDENLKAAKVSNKRLERILAKNYKIKINRKDLSKNDKLDAIRSYFSKSKNVLYIKNDLGNAREKFLLARELGFQVLNTEERPYQTRIEKIDSFEKLLNNFRASYFAAALLMDEQQLIIDFRSIIKKNTWQSKQLLALLNKYEVTPEMLLQRFTNLLPKHFGLADLFFLRVSGTATLKQFRMTKELHLSRLHNPHGNRLDEHYCRRWISVWLLKRFRSNTANALDKIIMEAQISKYWNSDNRYLCLTFALPDTINPKKTTSVTLGLMVTAQLKAQVNFLEDENLIQKTVHTTCERCSMPNCEARAVSPIVIEMKTERRLIEEALKSLD